MRPIETPSRAPLAGAAILLTTGLALLLVPGGARVAAPAAELGPTELTALSVQLTPRVARRVERIRGLSFARVPDPEVVDSERLTRIERRELAREGARTRLAADEAVVSMLGLLAPGEDLDDAVGATAALAAAAYDTRRDRLYVVEGAVAPNRALVEFVLAHELTHALEDSRFGLVEDPPRLSDDEVLARLALNEGTATATMVSYARGHLSAADLLLALEGLDGGTGDVPEFVVEQLEWAYLGGMEFVETLRALAGGWKLVDHALGSRPPASTEQVLHPEKYVADERPRAVEIDGRALQRAGWALADAGDAGEYPTSRLLALGGDAELAELAAAGWDGDRYELWRRGTPPSACVPRCRSELVLVLRWAWDSPRDVREFRRAAGRYLESGLGGEPRPRASWALDDGVAVLDADGTVTTLALAPTRALAGRALGGSGG